MNDIISRVMRKPEFRLGENKAAAQLRSNCEADQRLNFRYTYSTFITLVKFLALFWDCTGQFVLDLVGTPEDRFFSRRGSLHSFLPCRIVQGFWKGRISSTP